MADRHIRHCATGVHLQYRNAILDEFHMGHRFSVQAKLKKYIFVHFRSFEKMLLDLHCCCFSCWVARDPSIKTTTTIFYHFRSSRFHCNCFLCADVWHNLFSIFVSMILSHTEKKSEDSLTWLPIFYSSEHGLVVDVVDRFRNVCTLSRISLFLKPFSLSLSVSSTFRIAHASLCFRLSCDVFPSVF